MHILPTTRTRRVLTFAAVGALLAAVITAAPAHAATKSYPVGGLIRDPGKAYLAPQIPLKSVRGADALPTSVDLTQYAVTPGDQGQVGSCVSWGVGYTTLGWYSKKAGDEQAFAPMYLYSQVHYNNSSDGGGSTVYDNYATVRDQGIVRQADYPQGNYNWTSTPTAAQHTLAAQYRTTNYHELFYSTSDTQGVGAGAEPAIKQALATGNPVGISIPIYEPMYYTDQSDSVITASEVAGTEYEGGHFVVALGYNDQGITIENSWGTSWGNNGFATLSWDFVNAHVLDAQYITGILKYMPADQTHTPSIPTIVKTAKTKTSVDLYWQQPADAGSSPITGYELHVTGSNFNKRYTAAASSTAGRISGLKPYTKYTFSITAVNDYGASPVSTKTVTTTGNKPTVAAKTVTTTRTTAKLTWHASAKSGHITKYVLVVKQGSKIVTKHTYSASSKGATVKKLKHAKGYKYTLTVYNSAGLSGKTTHSFKTK